MFEQTFVDGVGKTNKTWTVLVSLVAQTGDWLRRMQKSLDQMNVRVHRAVSDIEIGRAHV